jgi:hypothetical protein
MDLAAARQVVTQLYTGIVGVEIARAEQQRLNIGYYFKGVFLPHPTITYGEVTAEALHDLLTSAAPREGEVFFDLGSGIGQAVFMAALTFDFTRLVGVELLDGLVLKAREALAHYDAEVRGTLPGPRQSQQIEFRLGDMLQVDLGEVDVAFAYNACYGQDLQAGLVARMETLRKGARVITVGQSMPAKCLELQRMSPCVMPWGETSGYLYIRA